ncbi:DUF1652 domain-containing protein [Pseudomonas sp. NPDC087614]|uniref:DUF1652 domain-containing protein n=2 Tax=unclassified Pseudomonas TaxID=196821 RepID=UPI003807B0CE
MNDRLFLRHCDILGKCVLWKRDKRGSITKGYNVSSTKAYADHVIAAPGVMGDGTTINPVRRECLGWLLLKGVDMLSNLELRHIIESAFLPLSCTCQIEPQGYLQAQIHDPLSGRIELMVTGISITCLTGNQAITALVDEIRAELSLAHEMRAWPRERAASSSQA